MMRGGEILLGQAPMLFWESLIVDARLPPKYMTVPKEVLDRWPCSLRNSSNAIPSHQGRAGCSGVDILAGLVLEAVPSSIVGANV